MKFRAKHVLNYGSVFIVGVIIGATILFYLSHNIPARLMISTVLNDVTYNASNNIRVLTRIRSSEIENAIEILEGDLDTNIITLNSLRRDDENLTAEDKDKIESKLKLAKKYRLENPRNSKKLEIKKLVQEALSEISIE